jgi:hypothetical protein
MLSMAFGIFVDLYLQDFLLTNSRTIPMCDKSKS